MNLDYIKALHIVFVVTWFAGLFYIVRLFIYQAEATKEEDPKRQILIDQYRIMQKRLWYGITWPSAILASIFGVWMYGANFEFYITQAWMMLKLVFVGLLWLYQIQCQRIFSQQRKNIYRFSSTKLRLWNEVATVFLFAIVFLVVVKTSGSLVWTMLGLAILTGLLLLGIFIYKKQRERDTTAQIGSERLPENQEENKP